VGLFAEFGLVSLSGSHGLPDSDALHESKIESAIIGNLQSFLLELGKGFAFVGRQKRLQRVTTRPSD